MGTTLSNTQIRNTYSGLLKTADNSVVAGTLKTVSDGAGNDTGLKVSSNEVNVNSLSIEAVPANGALTKMLMWNDSTKDVEYRNYNPSGVNLITADTITSPDDGAQIQLDGGPAICNFIAGSNIEITGSGSSVTINTSLGDAAEQVNFAMTENLVSNGAGDFFTEIVHTFTAFDNTNTVSRIRGTQGVDISSEANTDGGRDFTIDAGKVTKLIQISTSTGDPTASTSAVTSQLPPLLDLTNETAGDMLIMVNASQMNLLDKTNGNMNQRTITLPPPYAGRKIKIVFVSVPSQYSGAGGIYNQGMDHPIRFEVAATSDKDGTFRQVGFFGRARLNASNPTLPDIPGSGRFGRGIVGYTSRTSYLYFQDVTMQRTGDPHNGNSNQVLATSTDGGQYGETDLGLATGDVVEMVAVNDKAYMCDIVTYAPYNVVVQGEYHVFNSGNHIPTP